VRGPLAALLFTVAAVLAGAPGCGVDSEVSRELGARCDSLDECDDRCLTGPRFPEGMCSRDCDDDDDCPAGASCAELEGGVCLYACRNHEGCAFLGAGWRCLTEPERGGEPGAGVMVCVAPE